MSNTPHGGTLINRVLDAAGAKALKAEAAKLPAITVSPAEVWDLKLIAIGGYSPLKGFISEKDYAAVIEKGRLADGTPWTVPITLSVVETKLKKGDRAALKDDAGKLLGAIKVSEVYSRNLGGESKGVFKTEDEKHPGVARIKAAGQKLVAGDVDVLPDLLPADEQG